MTNTSQTKSHFQSTFTSMYYWDTRKQMGDNPRDKAAATTTTTHSMYFWSKLQVRFSCYWCWV